MNRINSLIIGLLITLLVFPFASFSVFASWVVTGQGALIYEFEGEVLGDSDESEEEESEDKEEDEPDEPEDDEKDENENDEVEVESESSNKGKDNTKVKIKVKEQVAPGQAKKLEIETENDKVKIKIEGEDGEEYEYESEETEELEIEEAEYKHKVKIRSKNNAAYVIQNKLAARTNFPLQVNLETNELIVTTPKGSKVVTVLPDKAVENMLAANVLDQLGGKGGLQWLAAQEEDDDDKNATDSGDLDDDNDATDSGDLDDDDNATDSSDLDDDDDATPSAEPSPEPEPKTESVDNVIELELDDEGTLVYQIEGVKYKKFLGVRQITLTRTAVVSAETGELLELRQDFLTQLKDLLSA